jgi:hypothetical protein
MFFINESWLFNWYNLSLSLLVDDDVVKKDEDVIDCVAENIDIGVTMTPELVE